MLCVVCHFLSQAKGCKTPARLSLFSCFRLFFVLFLGFSFFLVVSFFLGGGALLLPCFIQQSGEEPLHQLRRGLADWVDVNTLFIPVLQIIGLRFKMKQKYWN